MYSSKSLTHHQRQVDHLLLNTFSPFWYETILATFCALLVGRISWNAGQKEYQKYVNDIYCFIREKVHQPLPIAAAANEKFKEAIALDRSDEDFAAVYEATTVKNKNH